MDFDIQPYRQRHGRAGCCWEGRAGAGGYHVLQAKIAKKARVKPTYSFTQQRRLKNDRRSKDVVVEGECRVAGSETLQHLLPAQSVDKRHFIIILFNKINFYHTLNKVDIRLKSQGSAG